MPYQTTVLVLEVNEPVDYHVLHHHKAVYLLNEDLMYVAQGVYWSSSLTVGRLHWSDREAGVQL